MNKILRNKLTTQCSSTGGCRKCGIFLWWDIIQPWKEGSTDKCYMYKLQKYYAKLKKLVNEMSGTVCFNLYEIPWKTN